MKAAACILMIILGVLWIEPLFSHSTNQITESSCCKSKCNKPKPTDNKKDCENNRCNPLMACPTGNFFVNNYSHISIAALIISKQKTALVNDNRILKQLTECWHPPEII